MTFLLRQVSQTADGREIVRATPIARMQVTIGRAAECDIALPDLAVLPRHIVLDSADGRHVTATASNTLDFTVDGRRTMSTRIDAARGAEIKLGGHRITLSSGEPGQIVLTVQRVDAVSEADEDRDEATAFSLRGLLPGKRSSSWALAILILLVFLVWPVASFIQARSADSRSIYAASDAGKSWSSGPLSEAHHSLEKNCTACHQQAFVSVRDTSCKSCHQDAHDHAPAARLADARAAPGGGEKLLRQVAAAFNKAGPGACVDCHSEHQGAGRMEATRQAFCADCHSSLKDRLRDTKIGNAADFGTAHPQFRPLIAAGAGGQAARVRTSLDRHPRDDNGLKFPHKLHLDARGGVARMAQTLKARMGYGDALVCADCHMPTADGVRFLPIDMEKNCQACHSLAFDRIGGTVRTLRHGKPDQMMADLRALYRSTPPARPLELGGMARRRPGNYAQGQVYHAYFGAEASRAAGGDAAIRAVFSKGGACYDCHAITPPGSAGASTWQVMPVQQPMRYMAKGWFDHQAHKTEKCETCHAARGSASAQDLLLPGIKTCRNCHQGEAAVVAKVPSSCALCHSYHAGPNAPWVPAHAPPRETALVSTPPGGMRPTK